MEGRTTGSHQQIMRQLAEIDNVRAAQGFADYLNGLGIACQCQASSSTSLILLVNEHQLAQAQQLYLAFQQNPYDEKYYAASWQTGTTSPLFQYQGQSLNLVSRFMGLSPLILCVTVVSVLVYLVFILGGFNQLFPWLAFDVEKPYTWLTPAIMHFSSIHIIFNLMWWMYLGDKLIKELGKMSLLVVFVVSALASNWLQFLLVDGNFGGLSGVVYSLLGFCWLYGHFKPHSSLKISNSIVGFMLVWLVLGFADVLFVSMANWAHLAGLVSGMMLGSLYAKALTKN